MTIPDSWYKMLVDAIVDEAVFLFDPKGRVATWNTGAERLKGYAEAEVIGRSVEMFYRPEDVVAGVPYDELEIATRHDHFSGDGWRMRANGECVRVSTSVHAIRDDDGALVGFSRATRRLPRSARVASTADSTAARLALIRKYKSGSPARVDEYDSSAANGSSHRGRGRPRFALNAELLNDLHSVTDHYFAVDTEWRFTQVSAGVGGCWGNR